MNILMTTDTVGGVWSYALELARALEPFDVEVALATMGGPISPAQQREAADIPHLRLYEGDYRLEWMNDPWESVARAGEWLLDLARDVRPDVVHLNNYAHGALPWEAPVLMVGHSCVLSWHEAVRGGPAGSEWNRYRAEVARGLAAADLVVAPTRAMLAALERFYGPLSRMRVISNGRDPARYGPGEKEPFLLAAGRLWDEAKNVALLARVAPALEWPVAVAGSQAHPEGGQTELAGVRLLGQLDPAAMADAYARASIYALPARYEPFGLSVLEAALSGCALVLGDIATFRELWDGAALFAPPDDETAWTRALRSLIADKGERNRLATRAQARARELTSARMGRAYDDAYRQLAGRRQVAVAEMPGRQT